ncbi:MAG TPA: DUF2085 domain-containing protein [Chloroflexota bacterium]|nr:DUF2085 domain-containing protein [Chloroflexota bacterium]
MPASTHLRTPVHPLLLGGLVLALVGFLLLPGSFASKLLTLVAGVCAQRPAHSYFMGGVQLPLEARMGGIFAGFLVGVLYLLWTNRERAGLLPPPPLQALLLGFVALMAVDGTNALFYDTGWPSLYPPNNAVRLATGLLCGLALALLAVPVLSATLWRDWDFEASLASLPELGWALCLLALVQLATMSGAAALLYPVGLFMIAGVVVAFAVGNTYAVVLISRHERQASTWAQAANPLLAGVLIALVELAALAAFRYWAEAALGLRWVA